MDGLNENLGFGHPICGDCTTFPLPFRQDGRYCRSISERVNFGDLACERQADRVRPQTLEHMLIKLEHFKQTLTRLGERLDFFTDRPHLIVWPHRTRLYGTVARMKLVKKHIDEEVKGLGKHQHFRQLRNLRGNAIYIVDCMDFTKIGYTSSPLWQRMHGLKNATPLDFTLIAVAPGTRKTEKKFHAAFGQYRHRGEWFRLADEAKSDLLSLIKRHKGQILTPPIVYATATRTYQDHLP